MKKIIGLILAVMIMGSGQAAHAQVIGSIYADFRANHREMNFIKQGSSGRYVLSAANTQLRGRLKGAGALVALTSPIEASTSEILGREIGGQMSLEIVHSDEDPILKISVDVNEARGRFPFRSKASFVLPCELVSGDWDDLQSGKSIRIRTTAEGAEAYSSEMEAFLKRLVANAFPKGFNGMPVLSDIKSISLAQPLTLTVTGEKAVVENLTTDFKVMLSLGY